MPFDIRYATKEQLAELQRHIERRREQNKPLQVKSVTPENPSGLEPPPTEQLALWETENER